MDTIVLRPKISEKSYYMSEKTNTYVFEVPIEANSQQISRAVQSMYKVRVVNVNTLVVKGKAKRSSRRRSQPVMGRRKNVKKAYVTLDKADSIKMFEEGA